MEREYTAFTDYKHLYATLVGRVDSAVTALEQMTERRESDWFHVIKVTEMLKSALLEAEEAYIDADEEQDCRLIVLHSAKGHPEGPQ